MMAWKTHTGGASGLCDYFFHASDYPNTSKIRHWDEADVQADKLVITESITDYSPLKGFHYLKQLWVHSVNQEQLDMLSELVQLESLTVHWLHDVTDFTPLAALTDLRTLGLYGNPKASSLEPIGRLSKLRALAMWSLMGNYRDCVYDSFSPLANLTNLQHLELYGIKPADRSLAPLGRLKALEELGISNIHTLEEFARLAAELPDTRGIFQMPYHSQDQDGDWARCSRCMQRNRVMLTGAASPQFVCPVCDCEKLEKHVEDYQRLRRGLVAAVV